MKLQEILVYLLNSDLIGLKFGDEILFIRPDLDLDNSHTLIVLALFIVITLVLRSSLLSY